jgi:hypothetical protein
MKHLVLLALVVVAACGPAARSPNGNDGDDDSFADASEASCVASGPEVCNDGVDNDCDERSDCSDVDCSGVGDCPVCGEVEAPEAQPLPLPDGISSGAMCSTDAQCSASAPYCVAKECHASYISTLNFVGFPTGATLTDPSKLLKVCVNMEHSYLRDLQIELITPGGGVFILHKFVDFDRMGNEIFLGAPYEADETGAPVPGTGMQYCWTPNAAAIMLDSPTQEDANSNDVLLGGEFRSVAPWSALANAPLNGEWQMRVTDLWAIDNGFMFEWSISFDPSLVADCGGPIIL